MILRELKDYYDRKSADPESGIAPEGFEHKEIPFVIVLDIQGRPIQIKNTRTQNGKFLRAQSFLVPQAEKRTRGIKANLLWDNAEYLLGLSKEDSEKSKKEASQKHKAFVERIKELNLDEDEGVKSVLLFLGNNPIQALEKLEYFPDIKEENPFISFQLNKDTYLISERKIVIEKILGSDSASKKTGTCLVTGEQGPLSKLQPSIKGVRGANTTGGNIVSFNLSAFNSYGKTQGENAPIGEQASFAYTTALNHLLGKDSNQKIQVGDASVVFWSASNTELENNFSSLFDEPTKDNPDALTNSVKALYRSVQSGFMPDLEQKTRFFVLGLSPNAARISIRFWQTGTVADFSKRVVEHFNDLKIDHAEYEPEYLSLWRLLLSTAIQNKTENIAPNIAGDWMRTILAGLPYPDSLYHAVVRRLNADREVNYSRAAIIKGYLNRLKKGEEITVSLNKESGSIGYQLGRLFCVFEKTQQEAHERKLNSDVNNRFYSSASATPNSVFSILIRSNKNHLKKLSRKNPGRAFNLDKLTEEIMDHVFKDTEDRGFPSQLDLEQQGRFAIGYYHQRADLFKKECDLLLSSCDPQKIIFSKLPLESDHAYIRYNDNLFYCNKWDEPIELFKGESEKIKNFDQEMKISELELDQSKKLSEEELKQINSITGHSLKSKSKSKIN